MSKRRNAPKKPRFPYLPVLIGVVALGLALAASGFAYAASQEQHDTFCASCHTQPESTYFQRSTAAPAIDLAAYHTGQNTRCIDCHSGQGTLGRMQAELLGARNAAAWYTHLATQPAPLTFPIADSNCLKCHADVTLASFRPKESIPVPGGRGEGGGGGETGRPNHWHAFLPEWQQTGDPNAATCTSCHSGHGATATAQTGFMDAQTTTTVCNDCHRVAR